jgi:hypothetical protein
MRERGKYQIQLMKTRSSSGVGMKIDLDFDIDTLRITDPGEEGQTDDTTSRSSSILNNLQRNSTISSDPTEGTRVSTSKVQVESSKLRQLLSNLPNEI